ncbi:MAG: ABC transporter substrate-binding protein [Betaproteobacteria bacterium]|nr:ABC transporter substrate-binding protein [Betaproteobacteria bacterium]
MKRFAVHPYGFIAACLLFAFAVLPPAVAQTKLKVAEGSRSFTVMPLYIAMEAGYLAEKGLSAELITMKGGPAAANALISGDVDITFSLAETPIKMRSQGKDLRVAALLQDRNPIVLVVPANSTAKTVADLKGMKIGVTATGSLSDLILRAHIRSMGFVEADFEIVGLGSGATVSAAIERNQLQAAATFTPFLTKLVMEKTARVLSDLRKEIYPGQAMLIRGGDLGGPKEAALRGFVEALAKAAKALYSDRALVSRAARVYFPDMNPQLLEAMIVAETQETPVFSRDARLSRADYDWLMNFLLSNKLVPKAEKYEDIVATQLWR